MRPLTELYLLEGGLYRYPGMWGILRVTGWYGPEINLYREPPGTPPHEVVATYVGNEYNGSGAKSMKKTESQGTWKVIDDDNLEWRVWDLSNADALEDMCETIDALRQRGSAKAHGDEFMLQIVHQDVLNKIWRQYADREGIQWLPNAGLDPRRAGQPEHLIGFDSPENER